LRSKTLPQAEFIFAEELKSVGGPQSALRRAGGRICRDQCGRWWKNCEYGIDRTYIFDLRWRWV